MDESNGSMCVSFVKAFRPLKSYFVLAELTHPPSSHMCSRSRTWLWHLQPQSVAVEWSTSTQTNLSGCPTSRHGSAASKTRLRITHWHHPTSCPIHQSEHFQCITAIKRLITDLFSFTLWLCLTDRTCSHRKKIIA